MGAFFIAQSFYCAACAQESGSVDGSGQEPINQNLGKNQEITEVCSIQFMEDFKMAFFQSAVGTLQTLVVALGAGLGIWGAINLMEGYGNDNPGAKSQGMKQFVPSLM